MKINLKNLWPHLVAVLVFIVLAAMYFSPVWDDMQLRQSDVKQYQGAAKELADYRMMNGEEALWTNTMFGGMPAYQISVIHHGNWMGKVSEIMRLGLPTPVGILFVMMIGFYILGLCMRINPWVAMVCAVAFGFASFNILYLGAGHLTKVNAVSYMAPTLGGLLMATRGKWLWGSVVFSFFLALNISANHFQITYYLLIMLAVVAFGEGIRMLMEKKSKELLKVVGVLVLATGLAILPSASNLLTTYEYAKYSTRGESDISVVPKGTDKNTKAKVGLDKSYILEYNFGENEALSLFIPNAKGGSGGYLGNNETAMEKIENPDYYDQIAKSNQYWGGQSFSGGAIYLGAVAMFLFLAALFLVKDSMRYVAAFLGILCVLLSSKTGSLNFWFIDHFPVYNKFRDTKMILVVLQVMVPFMAMMLLDKLYKGEELQGKQKYHLGVFGGLALLAIVLYAAPSISGSFLSGEEISQFNKAKASDPSQSLMIQGFETELTHVRTAIYKADAGRTLLFFVGVGIALILAFYKVNRMIWLGLIGLFIVADEINVDLRYLNTDVEDPNTSKYENKVDGVVPYLPNKSDVAILQMEAQRNPTMNQKANAVMAKYASDGLYEDQPVELKQALAQFTALQLYTNYRVFNFNNPFNETVTSFFHKSVGGYHGAKVKRYQQLVDFYMENEMQKANASIGEFKMAKLQNYARTMNISQEQAKAVYDTISVAGAELSDSCQIFNMLNTRYLIVNPADAPVVNKNANGNVWFVSEVKKTKSANEELLSLGQINTKTQAVLDESNSTLNISSFYKTDSNDVIKMTSYATKMISYKSESSHVGFAVFSEIYYPEGWVCRLDGKELASTRVNYILRGVEIPAGKHTLTWTFEPSSFVGGTNYSLLGSLALLLSFFGIGALEVKKSIKSEKVLD